MRLDKDLIREILLAVEASNHDPSGWMELEIPGHTPEEVSYHVQLLDEAGFLEAQELTSLDGCEWRPKRLTYQGHEFLDTIRDGELWKLTKEGAKKIGVTSVQALIAIAKTYAQQKLIEHGIHI